MMNPQAWDTVQGKQRLADASLLLTKIGAHHGNAVPSDLQVKTFAEELMPTYTLADAVEAIRQFYMANVKNQWMSSAQLNAGIRALRRKRIPEETQIGELMDAAHVDADHMLLYRRELIKGIQHGLSAEQSAQRASVKSKQLCITAAPEKPKRQRQYHFACRIDRMNLHDVLGETS